MHAILIRDENMPLIREADFSQDLMVAVTIALTSQKDWYAVRGYYKFRGEYIGDTVLPAYLIENNFEYDHDKIQTDWDQIVRK